jgi:predicted transcriptional regulator
MTEDPAWRPTGSQDPEPNTRFALLLSIQPRFAAAILDGTKTVELRRRPPLDLPDVAIIYSSGKTRSVQGIAWIKEVHTSSPNAIWKRFGPVSGVTRKEFFAYFDGSDSASAIELSSPLRAPSPMPLGALRVVGLEPPQSWRYVDETSTRAILRALGLPPASTLLATRRAPFRRPTNFVPSAFLDLAFGGFSTRIANPVSRAVEQARCFRLDVFRAVPSLPTRRTRPKHIDLQ